MKKIFRLMAPSALILTCLLCLILIWSWPDSNPVLVVCDVGQGDAILIQAGFTQVLIDAGQDPKAVLNCLNRHLPWFDRQIELVVVTHPHSDHLGGMGAVLDRFSVEVLMVGTEGLESPQFRAFREAVLRKIDQGTQLQLPRAGQRGLVGEEIEYLVLSPQEQLALPDLYSSQLTETTLSAYLEHHSKAIKNYNDRSISLKFTIKGTKIILTGDIEKDTEQAIVNSGLLDSAHILKVAHHGSKTSTTETFLNKVRPEIGLISVGKNNRYRHPSPEVIARLERLGTRVFRTDLEGEIRVRFDGAGFRVESEREKDLLE